MWVCIVAYACYFHGVASLLWEFDPTRFSFLITGIYVITTIYLGIRRQFSNFPLVQFISSRLTSIGLIGTVIGIMLLMMGVGSSNLTELKEVVGPLFHGMGTLLVTTLFGMMFSVLLDFQIAFVFGVKRE